MTSVSAVTDRRNRDEDCGHLTDAGHLPRLGEDLVGEMVRLPHSCHNYGGEIGRGQLHHRVLQRAAEHEADPVNVVTDPGHDLGEVHQVLPVRLTAAADGSRVAVAPLVTLHPDCPEMSQVTP